MYEKMRVKRASCMSSIHKFKSRLGTYSCEYVFIRSSVHILTSYSKIHMFCFIFPKLIVEGSNVCRYVNIYISINHTLLTHLATFIQLLFFFSFLVAPGSTIILYVPTALHVFYRDQYKCCHNGFSRRTSVCVYSTDQ